jgi:hypothetical protein
MSEGTETTEKVMGTITDYITSVTDDEPTLQKALQKLQVELVAFNFVPSQDLISLVEELIDDEWEDDDEDEDEDWEDDDDDGDILP